MSCDAFSTKFKQMCSKIGLIKRGFGLKAFFYYRNKWSNSGPNNLGLNRRVGLLTVGLICGDCSILKSAIRRVT